MYCVWTQSYFGTSRCDQWPTPVSRWSLEESKIIHCEPYQWPNSGQMPVVNCDLIPQNTDTIRTFDGISLLGGSELMTKCIKIYISAFWGSQRFCFFPSGLIIFIIASWSVPQFDCFMSAILCTISQQQNVCSNVPPKLFTRSLDFQCFEYHW